MTCFRICCGDLRKAYAGVCMAAAAICGIADSASGMADAIELPKSAIPTMRCVADALRGLKQVRSVDLYALDGDRFAIEYSFRNAANRRVTSDIEFFVHSDGSVTATDKIPLTVPRLVAVEAQELESKAGFVRRCGVATAFDNVTPEAPARGGWRKIEWPVR